MTEIERAIDWIDAHKEPTCMPIRVEEAIRQAAKDLATLRSENDNLIAAWAAYASSHGYIGKDFEEVMRLWNKQVSRERTQATQK